MGKAQITMGNGRSSSNLILALVILMLGVNRASNSDVSHVRTVHLVSSNHLDVGFAGSVPEVINFYFGNATSDGYFAEAAKTANELKSSSGAERLVFTTHSYLVSLFLDCPPRLGINCPDAATRGLVLDALRSGDIVMHAFPFNAELATLESTLFEAGLDLTHVH